MARKTLLSTEQVENIIHLYTDENMSVRKISNLCNIGERVISRILRENSVEVKNNSFYRRKYCNETFFDEIDTEEKAYWLGFIYADGCISCRTGTDVFEVKLAEADKAHLEKLKSSLQSEHHIGTYVSTCGYNIGKTYCSISIVNQHLVDGLIKNGVMYRKTHMLKFPDENQVPRNLISHFIRGYFDGDGSVYSLDGANTGGVSFTGNENMLNGILNEIKKIIPTKAQVFKYQDKDAYDLKIGGSNYLRQCYGFFYKDATIFLDRKKIKFEDILLKQAI